MTCHDGFTLNDLVSYNQKHNEANGSNNSDGSNDNVSWNCGVEGPTDDPAIEALRNRQVKNFLTIGLLAAGTPMLLMGDEVRRSQGGNNNAYCQDSEISWFDWSLLDRHPDIHRFVKELNAFRQRRDVVKEGGMLTLTQLWSRAQHRVARRGAQSSGLERSLPFPRLHAAQPRMPASCCTACSTPTGSRWPSSCRRCPPDTRSTGGAASTRRWLARRHLRLGDGAERHGRDLPRGAPFLRAPGAAESRARSRAVRRRARAEIRKAL